jgi:hypothetical protein
MKKLPIGASIALVLFAFTVLGWCFHAQLEKIVSHPQAVASVSRSAPNSPVVTRIMPRDDTGTPGRALWDKYALARHNVLQQNPELAAENKELLAEMTAQQQKLEAAIIRADPQTASILAKYHAMRERRMAMMNSTMPAPVTPPGSLTK